MVTPPPVYYIYTYVCAQVHITWTNIISLSPVLAHNFITNIILGHRVLVPIHPKKWYFCWVIHTLVEVLNPLGCWDLGHDRSSRSSKLHSQYHMNIEGHWEINEIYIYIYNYIYNYIYILLSIVILSQNQKIIQSESHWSHLPAGWGARQQSSWDVPKVPWSFTQRGARNSENELLKLVGVGGQKSLGKLTNKICIRSINIHQYPSISINIH